jgi:hypothetical protein
LRGGEPELAREVFRRFEERTTATRRYRYIILRCRAVLAGWEAKYFQALDYLLEAEKIAGEFELVGESWLLDLEIARTAQACKNSAEAASRRAQAARKVEIIASGLVEPVRLLFNERVGHYLTGGLTF